MESLLFVNNMTVAFIIYLTRKLISTGPEVKKNHFEVRYAFALCTLIQVLDRMVGW